MPTVYAGWEGTLRYANEDNTSYSTIPVTTLDATGSWIGVIENFEPSYVRGLIPIRGVGQRDLFSVQKGREEAECRIEYIMQNITFLSQQSLFGTITGSFTLEAEYLSGSAAAQHPTQYIYMSGSKIESATIATRVGEPVRATVVCIGRNLQTGSVRLLLGGATNTASAPLMYWNGGAYRSASAGGARTQISNVTEFTFTVRNNLERVYAVDTSTQLRVLPEKGRDIEGELTTNFDDFDEYATLVGGTAVTLHFALTTGTTGSLYDCKFGRTSFPTRSTDLINLRLPFTASSGSLA